MLQVFGGDRAKTRRISNLHQDVEALLLAQEAADAEYARVAGRNVEVRSARPELGNNGHADPVTGCWNEVLLRFACVMIGQ